ncbi:MAG TPA: hypothetical protein VLM38_25000 [Blastocatellia bacterium]|nr:hypothetical protein [Blastocatellia bacterium]
MVEQSSNIPWPSIRDAIARIAGDNKSGAAEILGGAGNLFALLSAELSNKAPLSDDLARQAVNNLAIALAQAQPGMSPLLKLASAAVSAARESTSGLEALDAAARAASKFVEAAAQAASATARHGASLIGERSRVLTHSRSSTVVEAFVEARREGRDFSVVATEGRPLLEGRALAASLAREGVPVTLIADAAAALAMEGVDFVIVGADTVMPENLVNKIGTRLIALAAREKGLPIYALCDTSKFVGEGCSAGFRDELEVSEVWPDAPTGVRVINRYFEPTPLAYFTSIVTEHGALPSEEASLLARQAVVDDVLLNALEESGREIVR